MTSPTPDPILAKRARLKRIVQGVQGLGAALFLLSIVAFAIGMATGWSKLLTFVVVWSLLIGSLLLAPAIILSFGLRSMDDEDQEAARGR